MARNIDYDNLQDEDFQYLSERTWLISDQVLSGNTQIKQQVADWRAGVVPEDDGRGEEITYEQAKVEELRAELELRGLDPKGKKSELIARLEEDDEKADGEGNADDEEDNIPEED